MPPQPREERAQRWLQPEDLAPTHAVEHVFHTPLCIIPPPHSFLKSCVLVVALQSPLVGGCVQQGKSTKVPPAPLLSPP